MAALPPSQRTIRLLRLPTANEVGLFGIQAKPHEVFYSFREIPCFIGGRGFILHRLGTARRYHVRVGRPDECSCECPSFLFRGYCRHVLGLLTLIERGLL